MSKIPTEECETKTIFAKEFAIKLKEMKHKKANEVGHLLP